MASNSATFSEQLVKRIVSGDETAFFELSHEFDAMIKSVVNSVTIRDGEKEDLYQEGLIGLYKAAISFDESRGATFSTFAYLCIKHSIYSSLRVYFSKRNEPVRTSFSIDEVVAMQFPDLCTDPEKLLIEKENIQLIKKSVDSSLSEHERRVFKLFLSGNTYESIANSLQIPQKSVDNAIQRIRGKLKKFIK